REACLRHGMDDYLAKPLQTRALREALLRWGRAPSEGDASALAGEAPARSFDLDILDECSGGNAALVVAILDSFLRSTPETLDGIEAAAVVADAEELERAAHRLKGACHTIGAAPMAEACEALLAQARRGDLADSRTTVDALLERW